MKEYSSSIKKEKSGPKLFAWLASILLITLIIASQFLPRGHYPNLRILGVVILLAAPVFIFPPFFLLSKYGNKKAGKIYMQPGDVVDQGLYAILRHPQYLGYMMLSGGFGFLSQNLIILFLAILSIIFFSLQAIKEEEYCLDCFGKSYRDYLRRVPRFNIILGIWRVLRGKKYD